MNATARLCALALGAVLLAGCGSDGDGERKAGADPFSVVARAPSVSELATRKAAPRWEPVATLRGSGAATRSFAVARGAIQWRATYRCERGRLRLAVLAGTSRKGLASAACPRRGRRTAVSTGRLRLGVQASGPWSVRLEQQVDTALREPPLPAMRSSRARVIARGRFYRIERFGRGTASLYRLANGRLALRLENFATSANLDLFVWLSRASRPRTTVQAERAPHTVLAPLKSTLGDENYLLPRGTRAEDVRSIVIWCDPVQIAYTAATLRRR
jgi:hypothetical protein